MVDRGREVEGVGSGTEVKAEDRDVSEVGFRWGLRAILIRKIRMRNWESASRLV